MSSPQQYPPQPVQPESQPLFPPIRQKKPWFKRWWAIVLFIVVGLLALSALMSADNEAGPTTAAPQPTITITATETVAADDPAPTEAEPKPTKKAEPKPKAEPELGEGTYEVGKDVPAGQYKTTVPADSFGCYWERAKNDSGDMDSIIANDNADPGAKVSVTIKRGEFFKNNGCGDWAKQ